MKINICSDFVQQVTQQLLSLLGESLKSIVQLGSLAHGGYSPRFSDIDIAVILQHPVPDTLMTQVQQQLAELAPIELAQRISLFWTVPDFSWGRMRPVDQVDLCDNGELLWGQPLAELKKPTLEMVRQDMQQYSLPYWAEKTHYFTQQRPNTEAEFKEYVRCLLYPARLTITWQTGQLTSNDAAVAYASHVLPATFNRMLLQDALGCRNAQISDEQLFPYQPCLVSQRITTLRYLGLSTDE